MITIRIDVDGNETSAGNVVYHVQQLTPVTIKAPEIKTLSYAPYYEGFTDRERETLTYLCAGLSYPEIARAMELSVNTVRKHVEHMIGKLNLRSGISLAVWAVVTGAIEADTVAEIWQTYYPHLLEAT